MPTATGRASADDAGLRVDRFISGKLGVLSRSQLTSRLQSLSVNGVPAKLSRTLKPGDLVELHYQDPEPSTIEPEPVALEVVYEDDDVMVINKPAGMVVHPAAGNRHGTLVHALLFHAQSLAQAFSHETVRPGIVHRLDKATSGVIITAKHPTAHEFLAAQFKSRRTKKVYLGIVKGRPPASIGAIEGFIRRDPHHRKRFAWSATTGKSATTQYRVLRTVGGVSLVRLMPQTGRTHQLRVHMAHLGCPILGDPVYARSTAQERSRMMLHAFSLQIRLPSESGDRIFRAPLPSAFKAALQLPVHQAPAEAPARSESR